MKKNAWWILLLAVILVAVVLVGVFWGTIRVYLMPKAVLSEAVTNTAAALQTRTEGSPLTLLSKALNAEGCYAAVMELDAENDLLGDIHYDMAVQANLSPRRVYGSGTVTAGGSPIDLSLYLDGDFAAVSSDSLLKGQFYGLTYETFSEDIRSSQLLSLVLGNETTKQWEASIASLQETMSETYEAPEISEEDIRLILTGMLMLDSKVTSGQRSINGETVKCWDISYSATGEEIKQALSLLDSAPALDLEELESVSVTFSVQGSTLIGVDVVIAGAENLELELTFLGDAAVDPVSVKVKRRSGDVLENVVIEIDTSYDQQQYQETWDISKTTNGIQKNTSVSYTWDSVNGDMAVDVNREGETVPLQLNLSGTEGGFTLATEDLSSLLNVLQVREKPFTALTSCTMTVTKGAEISVPEYKNFDEWSLTDLWVLFDGIGGLFGLKIG